jgi:hypothetical protein
MDGQRGRRHYRWPRPLAPALGTSGRLPSFPDWLEVDMESVVDKVMQTFCMMNTLSDEETEEAKGAVSDFLANNPQEDEHRATVEGLTFLRNRSAD